MAIFSGALYFRSEIQAADVVCDRYSALLALLRQGKLEAVGDPSHAGGTSQILPSILSHRSYWFDALNGDILQKNENATDWHDIRLKRWSAVTLKRSQPTAFHVKPSVSYEAAPVTVGYESARKLTASEASIDQAIKALWPEGIPRTLLKKTRNNRINDWQKNNGLAIVSAKAVYRFLKRTN